jgi:hypothetical protein
LRDARVEAGDAHRGRAEIDARRAAAEAERRADDAHAPPRARRAAAGGVGRLFDQN